MLNNIKMGPKMIGGFILISLMSSFIGMHSAGSIEHIVIGTAIASVIALFIGISLTLSIVSPLAKGIAMMQEMVKGHLATRLKMNRKDEIGALADAMDEFADDLQRNVVGAIQKIGEGDLAVDLKAKDDRDEIIPAIMKTTESLKSLVAEAGMLRGAAIEGKLATRGKADRFKGGYKEIVQGVNDCLDAVVGPLNVAAEYVDKISKGNIPARITETYQGDFNAIKNNLNRCIDAVNALIADANMLSLAAVAGKLATRADAEKHEGDFRKIVKGVNDCLDAVIGPLNVAAEYVEKISKGNIPPKITDKYNGDFNTIKNNLNTCIGAVNALVADANMLSRAAVEGKLATRADATKHEGDFRKIVQGVDDCLDAVIGPLNVAAKYVDNISKGTIPAKITDTYNGDFNTIKNNLNKCIDAVNALVADAAMLSRAAVEGKLATRADAAKHEGDFRKIVQGVDDCLDAVIGPLNVAAKYVDDISKGVIPAIITDTYNGDFNTIKNNLNVVVTMMSNLLKETDAITRAAEAGELDKRANPDLFQGGWKQLVTGVNDTITNIVNPLMVTADYVDKVSKGIIPPEITTVYKGQYNLIKTNLNAVVKMMSDLLKETDGIIRAAADGELDKRANPDLFQGGWKQLVAGVNDTITNIVNPLMVTADYVDKVSKGIIPPEITTVYKGRYNLIKTNLNAVVKMMSDLLKETDGIIRAAADGELDKRANPDLFLGGWKQLVSGVNDTITNIVNPLMVTADYVEKVSKGVIPPEISDEYKGQYNLIKNNLNAVVKMMSALLGETNLLVQAAIGGQLATRANAGLFVGGWNELVAGVNKTLDSVLEPINEAAGILEKVAGRDMTARVKGDYKGDHAKIKIALNTAVDNLDQALAQAAESAEQVAGASQQISAGSQSLAQGANEQASSLEEVSSSLEEMSSMTKQNAENANQAKTLAAEANGNAAQGAEAMSSMSVAINKIKDSSDQTAKIVKTIDEIAMQTNLLALNAAVEAARAGEAGRGFAVVAEEVRNLAQRSAQAAKNTADMISESVKNAEDGVKISVDVSKSFESIAGSSKKVNDLINEIAAASKEQSTGIDQLNTAVAQMDKVTQQNAANSEESAGASEELSSQAEELQTMIAQFSLTSIGGKHEKSLRSQHPGRTIQHVEEHDRSGKTKVAFLENPRSRKSGNGKIDPEEIIPMKGDVLREF
jgi:methyl-accepting chemotaxis protein